MQKQAEEIAAAGGGSAATVKLDMTARYLGLVVVPGKHIVKIEVEEFASQMRKQEPLGVGAPATGPGTDLRQTGAV